jgi:hypothetical protein
MADVKSFEYTPKGIVAGNTGKQQKSQLLPQPFLFAKTEFLAIQSEQSPTRMAAHSTEIDKNQSSNASIRCIRYQGVPILRRNDQRKSPQMPILGRNAEKQPTDNPCPAYRQFI